MRRVVSIGTRRLSRFPVVSRRIESGRTVSRRTALSAAGRREGSVKIDDGSRDTVSRTIAFGRGRGRDSSPALTMVSVFTDAAARAAESAAVAYGCNGKDFG